MGDSWTATVPGVQFIERPSVPGPRRIGRETAKRRSAVGIEKASELREKAGDAGGEGLARAREATSRFIGGLADRARRRRATDEPGQGD